MLYAKANFRYNTYIKQEGRIKMWELYLLLLIQVVLGAGLIVLLWKISKMKKQVDEITREVKDYISFVIEDENTYDEDLLLPKNYKKKQKSDEAQSSLIQAVLGEIFP